MSKFTEVLKKRNFFLLWLGQIVSQLGDRLDQMALIGFIYARSPGSTWEIAKMLSFTIIPVFLIGPVAGVYVDRWDRRRTMYVCDFLRAALVLTIPLFLFYTRHLSAIYLIIFIVFCVGRFFVPAKLAIIPELVPKNDLLLANSLVNTTGMIAAVLGFGISGVLVEKWGAQVGFYLDSLSFLFSGTLIFLIAKKFNFTTGSLSSISPAAVGANITKVGIEIVDVIKKSVLQEIKEGIIYFVKNKSIRFTTVILFVLFSGLGAIYVVLIVFVQRTLHSATKDLGLLIMFLGIGLFVGSLLYGRFGQKVSPFKVIFGSLIFSGVMLVVFALVLPHYPCFLVAGALSLCLGIMVSPIMIATNTIIHQASDNGMMGKIFSSLEIVMHLGFLLFMFISSFLAEKFSPGIILICVGVLFSILGAFNVILYYYRRFPHPE